MGEFKEELSMKTDLFFSTGTGNSLWAARMLAKKMDAAEIIPISSTTGDPFGNNLTGHSRRDVGLSMHLFRVLSRGVRG
jgi:hypothetical protein